MPTSTWAACATPAPMPEGRCLRSTRTIGSTVVGQLVDTTVLMFVAFSGTLELRTIIVLIFSGYIGKVLYEAAMTPFTYMVVNWLKRIESVELAEGRPRMTTGYCPSHRP